MSSLVDRQKQLLLDIAHRALIAAVKGDELVDEFPEDVNFGEHAGAFVTLHSGKRLRGCIGQLNGSEPLSRVVAESAASAALNDPRFKPVGEDELAGIEIELSILSEPEDVTPGQIEPGKHGLIISRGWQRGVLLPQVAAERRWDAQRFLEETCAKAGLEPDAWKAPQTRIQAFTAEVFGDEDFPAGRASGAPSYSSST